MLNLKHQNNKKSGASLITVLIVVSFITVLIGIVYSVVTLNTYMKHTNVESKGTFYSAEDAMDEIRIGIAGDLSECATIAYTHILEDYGDKTIEEKTETFEDEIYDLMSDKLLADPKGSGLYSIDYVGAFLRDTKYDAATGVGAKMTNLGQDNHLNKEKHSLVLKNVALNYTDEKGNSTDLKADIMIKYPPIDFANASSTDNLLCYCLIAAESYEQVSGSKVEIAGNAYLGGKEKGASIKNGQLISSASSGGISTIISGGVIEADNKASIKVDESEVWADGLFINDGSTLNMNNGTMYIRNDMVLGDNSKATLSGSYYGYSNPDVVTDAESMKDVEVKTGKDGNVADYSSAIIVNGAKSGLDISGLKNFVLAGVSFVNANNNPVQMGQSIATKAEQRAYLVPSDVIGADYTNGGANPMDGDQYNKLRQEIANDKYEGRLNDVKDSDIVSITAESQSLGKSLKEVGAKGFARSVYAVSNNELVYFFITFEDTSKANEYFRNYYSKQNNLNMLNDNLAYYTSQGIKLPVNLNQNSSFYYEGNLLNTAGGQVVVPDKLQSASASKKKELKTNQALYQDRFMAFRKKVTGDYSKLTSQEKLDQAGKVEPFDNIVEKGNVLGTKFFVSEDGHGAVVTNMSNFTVNSEADSTLRSIAKDEKGQSVSNAKINLIISTGNVKVARDFTGLIIARGTVEITGNHSISSDSTITSLAINAKDIDGNSAADYMLDKDAYTIGGGATTDGDTLIDLMDLIVYKNWKKNEIK